MSGYQQTYVKNVSDHEALTVYGDPWDASTPWIVPKLQIRVVNGNVRVTAYANNPAEQGAKALNVKLDLLSSGMLMELLDEAANSPTFTCEQISYTDFDFAGGERSREMRVQGKIYVERDATGCICMHVEQKGRSRVRVKLLPSNKYTLAARDGTKLDDARISKLVTKGLVRTLSNILPIAIDKTYDPNKKKDGGNGGQQNKQRSAPPADDGIGGNDDW